MGKPYSIHRIGGYGLFRVLGRILLCCVCLVDFADQVFHGLAVTRPAVRFRRQVF